MELYETTGAAEKLLQLKADAIHSPLGGALELLPLCNMNCKMCYVRKSREQMEAEGRMLSCDEWLRIGKDAVEAGVLFLLLTGGEPLLYPEFKRLYTGLQKMGMILSVNTNGTLIDEDWADFFAENGVRRLNVTLYGVDDATYGELCRNPKGLSQVIRAAELLKARKVPFRFTCSMTPDNVDQLSELRNIAARFEVPLSAAAYMFPAERNQIGAKQQYRLSPQRAGRAVLESYLVAHPEANREIAARMTLRKREDPPRMQNVVGFTCHAGKSGFWLNWKGEMMPCGMFDRFKVSLSDKTFHQAWEEVVEQCKQIPHCADCATCINQNLCQVCPANCLNETGRFDGRPEYLCRMTEEMVRCMEAWIDGGKNGTG